MIQLVEELPAKIDSESKPIRLDGDMRQKILTFEQALASIPGAKFGDQDEYPVKHSFADGIYVREIFIPKGYVIVGKIHKHTHPNFLLKGDVSVVTEGEGSQRLKAPLAMISPPGTKRLLYTHEDTVWVTVHLNPSNTQDIAKLEEELIAPSYDAYEAFRKGLTCSETSLLNAG